jgi:hypothetical protein
MGMELGKANIACQGNLRADGEMGYHAITSFIDWYSPT